MEVHIICMEAIALGPEIRCGEGRGSGGEAVPMFIVTALEATAVNAATAHFP